MKNKILFIDFNGVISYKTFWSSLFESNHPWSGEIQDYLFNGNELILKWMKGLCDSEYVHEQIEKDLNIPKDELFEIFKTDCGNLDLSFPIRQELEKLKDKYIIILATDNMDSFNRFTLTSNKEYFNVFDRIVNSCDLGFCKKEKEGKFFQDVIEEFNVNSEDTIFIDDSKGNCEFFKKYIGGRSKNLNNEKDIVEFLREI